MTSTSKPAIISHKDGHYYIKKSEVPPEILQKYRNLLSNITPKTEGKFPGKPFSIWQEYEKYMKLPRELPQSTVIPYTLPEPSGSWPQSPEIPEFRWISMGNLYDYQEEAVVQFRKLYDSGRPLGGIIKFGCGRGKTRTGLACARELGKRTLIVTNGDAVCDTWIAEIGKTFPDFQEKFGEIQVLSRVSGKKRKELLIESGNPILITCYKTLVYPGNFGPADFARIDLVILDEIHEYLTPGALEIFGLVSRRFILGLSATPSKPNGLHYLLDWYVGPIFISCDNLYRGALPVIRRVIHGVSHLSLKDQTGTLLPYLKIQEIILGDPERMKLIVSLVREYLQDSGNKILVIGILREQLERYRDEIEGEFPGSCAIYYSVSGKKEKEERRRLIQEKPVVLAIRQLGAQSLNIPDLNVLILASKYIPKNDGENTEKIEQLCGRVLRKEHVKSPVIVDIVDNHFYFLKHDRLCCKYYESCGYKFSWDGGNLRNETEDTFEEEIDENNYDIDDQFK